MTLHNEIRSKFRSQIDSENRRTFRSGNIYIYSHPQTDCFVLSELFSVARHAGRLKPGSKPVQPYVRLSFKPVGHQADYVG